jgi:hypothetical protein
MTPRRIRLALSAFAVTAAGLAALVLVSGYFAPYDAGAPAAPGPATAAAARPAGQAGAVPALAEFEKLWDIDLRRPLVDPPPAVAAAAAIARPPAGVAPVGLKLAGTVVEPGHSVAVFVNAAGRSELKSVGDKAGAAEVVDIQSDRVTLRYGGAPVTLKVQKESRP